MAQKAKEEFNKEENLILSKNIIKIYESYFLIIPDYYNIYRDLLNNIIYEDSDSSFSLQYKLFYGIMGSSTLGSEYLLDDFKRIFLLLGGEKSWVEQGLKCENIPEHIKGMATINNILAHKPWIMDWRHFAGFKNGLSFFFFQSAIILTTIHRFASILSSLNLIIHNDIVEEEKREENNKMNKKKQLKETKEEEKIKNEIKDDEKEDKKDDNITDLTLKKKKLKNSKMEIRIQKIITSVKKNYTENKEEDKKNESKDTINKKEIFKKYISDLIISYTDFNPHIEKYLNIEEFDWKGNAKYFYFDYAGKEMEYLDKEFKFLENINSEDIKNIKKLDIFKLRGTIEKYIALIFGIIDDQYNYHLTNEYIPVELKRIIKKIASGPEQIKEQELSSCLEILSKEELIYLIFEVTSIRQRISLTFFAKAFEDFTSNNILLNNNPIDN